MVLLALALISIIDFFFHRIPHWTLVLLLPALAIEGKISFYPLSATLVFLISLALVLTADLGIGDLKLLLLLVATSIPFERIHLFLWLFSLISTLTLILHFLRTRSINGFIPLAPAIAGAFLLI